ncbi:endonuclease domain-containing protein [Streptosporangium sp. NPDC001559]|uniref:endonuclease domain-containing protein n=1 Tax=Streptosporangium sp. NPDC001559 TaxID=3366187 RepID=UPI0036ECF8B5
MVRSWNEPPARRVVWIRRADLTAATKVTSTPSSSVRVRQADFATATASAMFPHTMGGGRAVRETVAEVLDALEKAVTGLYPAWLPEASDITGPGGLALPAVRELARRTVRGRRDLAAFLADLAARSLAGGSLRLPHRPVPPETRAEGLAMAFAASFGRPHTVIVATIPEGLSPAREETLVGAAEWLTHHGHLGVCLTGAPLTTVDRVPVLSSLQEYGTASPRGTSPAAGSSASPPAGSSVSGSTAFLSAGPSASTTRGPSSPGASSMGGPPASSAAEPSVAGSSAVAGRPHPGSSVEAILERALSAHTWAAGRAWNQTYQPHPLVNPIKVDLIWQTERCVVELDGPDHRSPRKLAEDRLRDERLIEDGYAVIRFTNERVLTDMPAVLRELKRFLHTHRATHEG